MCDCTIESHIFVEQKSFAHTDETCTVRKVSSRAEFRGVTHMVNSKARMFAKQFCVCESKRISGGIELFLKNGSQ